LVEVVVVQFLLLDVSATLVFLLGYLTVVTLQRRRALFVPAEQSARPRSTRRPVRAAEGGKLSETAKDRRTAWPPRREWPRLIYPR
jgi:hypothetical protein